MSLKSVFKSGMNHKATPIVASGLLTGALTTLSVWHASTAMVTLCGPVALEGATEVWTMASASGEALVFSTVKATLLHKLILGTVLVGASIVIGYTTYTIIKEYNESK